MDSKLLKLIITYLVCEMMDLTIGASLHMETYDRNLNLKVKRSPADNFSLFGIKVPFSPSYPVSAAKHSFNTFGNLFTPSGNKQNDNMFRQRESETQMNIFPQIKNKNRNTETASSNLPSRNPNTIHTISHDQKVIKNESDDVKKSVQADDETKDTTANHKNNEDEVNKKEAVIDKDILDSIFNDVNQNVVDSTSTTEDTTIDYTTDSTTTDDLLRIAAPVVASLLG